MGELSSKTEPDQPACGPCLNFASGDICASQSVVHEKGCLNAGALGSKTPSIGGSLIDNINIRKGEIALVFKLVERQGPRTTTNRA